MMRPAYVLVGMLAVLLAAGAAGCSGDDREDFGETIRATRDDVDGSLRHMAAATTYEELINRLREASTTIERAADAVADTEPPDELSDERDELERSYRALANEVGATAEALEDLLGTDNPALQGIDFRNWNRTQQALTALRREGIEVAPLERY